MNCMNCIWADCCHNYCDVAPYDCYCQATLALCEGRHEMPEDVRGSIFGNEVNPLDVADLEHKAEIRLAGIKSLKLYVTGLTVALIAVLNVAHKNGIAVTLMHYDRNTNSYYRQEVK